MALWWSLKGSVSSTHSTKSETITPMQQRFTCCPGPGDRGGSRLLTMWVVFVISPHSIINHRLADDPSTARKSHTNLLAKGAKTEQKLVVWALFSFIRNFIVSWLGQRGQSSFLRPAASLIFQNKFLMNLRLHVALVQAVGQCFLPITGVWKMLEVNFFLHRMRHLKTVWNIY